MVRFEGITVPNENLTGKRLDTNVGGKYWQKTIPKMAKLASFLHKLSISWPITNFRTFFMVVLPILAPMTMIFIVTVFEDNVGVKYLKKTSPKQTKLVCFSSN